MSIKVAINGFGRIGRNVVRAIYESGRTDIDIVAINDLGPVETNAHLMRYDSVHGRFPIDVQVEGDTIKVGKGKDMIKISTKLGKAPAGMATDGTFRFPFFTIEDVARVDDTHILVANDNNLPYSGGREIGRAADNEFILLSVPELLSAR